MKTVTEHIRDSILKRVFGNGYKTADGPLKILDKQMCWKFLGLMGNRMIQGYFRYGYYKEHHRDLPQGIEDRLKLYRETKNKEYLLDIGNFAMIEFDHPFLEDTYFESVDDGVHVPD